MSLLDDRYGLTVGFPPAHKVRVPIAACMWISAAVSVAALLTGSSGLARAAPLLLGGAFIAYFANELRGTTAGGRLVLFVGLLAGALVLASGVIRIID